MQYLMEENIKVVLGQVFNFKLGCFAPQQHKRMLQIQPLLELKTPSRFRPVNWFVRHLVLSNGWVISLGLRSLTLNSLQHKDIKAGSPEKIANANGII